MFELFDDFVRVETRAATPIDRDYGYLNQTSRPAFALVRDVLEQWFAEYPAAGQSELAKRFRSPETLTHRGAFFELYCHALLVAFGFERRLHPTMVAKGRPDFLALRNGEPAFYLEATNVMPPAEHQAELSRDGMIDDCISKLGLRDFYVVKSVRKVGRQSPLLAKISAFLRETAASLDPENNDVRHLRFDYREQDWEIAFSYLPKPTSLRGGGSRTSLGVTTGPVSYPAPEKGITGSLKKKAGKYGSPDLPLVIAVNCLHEFVEFEDIAAAMYGTRGSALSDGFWRGPRGVKYTRVSAVLVFAQLVPWTIGSVDGWLWRNPAASNPLDHFAWPGNQVDWSDDSGCYKRHIGVSTPEILRTKPVSVAIQK